MKLLILGAGKMTEAILLGLKGKFDFRETYVFSPSGVSASRLAKAVGANHLDSLESISDPDLVIVGCKPQQLRDLKNLIGDRFQSSTFVSMLAALPESDQLTILGARQLVRVMPNLAVRFAEGVTLISSTSASDSLATVQSIFTLLGEALIVSEAELEELTILTGSGPGLFFEFAHVLAESFTALSPEAREMLVRKVLSGAATLASARKEATLSEHVSAVTSKGGVTIAVLESWRSLGFGELLKSGVEAGKQRRDELRALTRQS